MGNRSYPGTVLKIYMLRGGLDGCEQTGLGDECVRCMQWWCCVFGGSDTFDDSSTSTTCLYLSPTCLYLSPSQLCLIKRESSFKHTHVHAEQDRVMCIGLSKTREQFQ